MNINMLLRSRALFVNESIDVHLKTRARYFSDVLEEIKSGAGAGAVQKFFVGCGCGCGCGQEHTLGAGAGAVFNVQPHISV